MLSPSIEGPEQQSLAALKARLLSDRPPPLRPDQGQIAFLSHIVLAAVVHNAARLNQHAADSQTGAWIRYLTSYFPAGRNGEDDARLLWTDWRTGLLKKQAPGPGIVVTHGQSHVHWRRDELGRLCLNLEDLWNDFEVSIDTFVEFLRGSRDRRSIALKRARESEVAVIEFTATLPLASAPASGWAPVATASAMAHGPQTLPGIGTS